MSPRRFNSNGDANPTAQVSESADMLATAGKATSAEQAQDARRPSNTVMTHHRPRSNCAARRRKKKGTLVMRGVHEEDGAERDDGRCFKGPNNGISGGDGTYPGSYLKRRG